MKQLLKTIHIQRMGFTLVEVMVAVGIFLVVVMIAVGGFVRALRSQHQLEGLIAANSNVSLVIEQMAREIRTGKEFCVDPDPSAPPPCQSGDNHFSFTNANKKYVTYDWYLDPITRIKAIRRKENNEPPLVLTADNISVEYLTFEGRGFGPSPTEQPRATILLGIRSKEAGLEGIVTRLQTTVSSRQQLIPTL